MNEIFMLYYGMSMRCTDGHVNCRRYSIFFGDQLYIDWSNNKEETKSNGNNQLYYQL